MDNHNGKRKFARVVAIMDMILTSLGLCVPIILFLFASVATDETTKAASTEEEQSQWQTLAVVFWILFAVALLFAILQLWAAIKLLNATQIGKEPLEAAKMARVWRGVCIVFTVFVAFGIVGSMQRGDNTGAAIKIVQVLLRCIAIYIVHLFIVSAEHVAATSLPSRMPLGLTVGVGYTYMPTTTTANDELPKYEDLPEKR